MSDVSIRAAAGASDYRAFAALLADYVAWCRARHADDPSFVERVFGHQAFDEEILELPTRYGPPDGAALLAVQAEDVVGVGAWHRLADGTCEMKRVFVAERAQGRGVGRRLCEALLADARRAGFALMRMDTSVRFTEALAMYASLGFRHCAPYQAYPPGIAERLVFLERPLVDTGPAPRRQGD